MKITVVEDGKGTILAFENDVQLRMLIQGLTVSLKRAAYPMAHVLYAKDCPDETKKAVMQQAEKICNEMGTVIAASRENPGKGISHRGR